MTNKNRSKGKKNRGLKYVDLSFNESQLGTGTNVNILIPSDQSDTSRLNNGFRPHGGYKGTRKHPLSPFTHSQSAEFQQKLEDDLDKLFEEEQIERTGSPSWALDALREPSHSGECPLFMQKYLAASRVEQQYGNQRYPKAILQQKKYRPQSRDGTLYYRPNRSHQYLTATELKDTSQSEVDVKLGRPTRTTLLRARQRCESAPVSSYEARKERMKKSEGRAAELKKLLNSHISIRDMFSLNIPDGESMHSFLIGARYNRAHCLDAKSLMEHGVYMPRNNPNGIFVNPKYMRYSEPATAPNSPPETPVYNSDSEDESIVSAPAVPYSHMRSPPGTPISSSPTPFQLAMETETPREAWIDSKEKVAEDEKLQVRTMPEKKEGTAVIEELLNLDDGLNVKGKSYAASSTVRPKSAVPTSGRPNPYKSKSSKPFGLPSVTIQGTSISSKDKKPKDAIEQTTVANHPTAPCSTPVPGPKDSAAKVMVEEIIAPVVTTQLPALSQDSPGKLTAPDHQKISKEEPVVKTPPPPAITKEEKIEKPKVIKVDKSVNVPSIPGDMSHIEDLVIIQSRPREINKDTVEVKDQVAEATPVQTETSAEEQESKDDVKHDDQNSEKQPEPREKDDQEAKETHSIIRPSGSRPVSAVKSKKSRVRFADELTSELEDNPVKPSSSVTFFMTEDPDDTQQNISRSKSEVSVKSQGDIEADKDNSRNSADEAEEVKQEEITDENGFQATEAATDSYEEDTASNVIEVSITTKDVRSNQEEDIL